jgi:hypothetical protein
MTWFHCGCGQFSSVTLTTTSSRHSRPTHDPFSCCRFRPVGPRLSSTTQGLELSDVYALTIIEDAGLEMHHVELLLESRK